MTERTYRGSCECGKVRFEVDLDLSRGTDKCNCTRCFKRRWWSVKARPEAFRSLGGEAELSEYLPGQATGHRGFCRHCGIRPYGWVPAAAWNDGTYVSVNVACLDDLPVAELVAAPVRYLDGRNDDWWHAPAETRHL
jgi:hypothetical protein